MISQAKRIKILVSVMQFINFSSKKGSRQVKEWKKTNYTMTNKNSGFLSQAIGKNIKPVTEVWPNMNQPPRNQATTS